MSVGGVARLHVPHPVGTWLPFAGNGVAERMEPCARAVTNPVERCLVTDQSFEWCHTDFQLAPIHELVTYELHPATFAGTPGELGDRHQLHTIHTDVLYNHLGPSDLDLWRFDGWYDGDGGGIYFHDDWRAETAWGATRSDCGATRSPSTTSMTPARWTCSRSPSRSTRSTDPATSSRSASRSRWIPTARQFSRIHERVILNAMCAPIPLRNAPNNEVGRCGCAARKWGTSVGALARCRCRSRPRGSHR